MTVSPKTAIQQYSRDLATYTLQQFALARSLQEQDRASESSSTHAENSRGTKAPGVHGHS